MGKVEQQGCAYGIFFILGGEHSLCYIAAATWFSTRVPNRPPLHGNGNDQQRDIHGCVGKIGYDIQFPGHIRVGKQRIQTSYLRLFNSHYRRHYSPQHGHAILKEIGPDHPFDSAKCCIDHYHNGCANYHGYRIQAKHNPANLDGCERYRPHNQTVKQDTQV